MAIRDINPNDYQVVDIDTLYPITQALLKGYPGVIDLGNPTFAAMGESLKQDGQLTPLKTDEKGGVWDGRTRLALMRLLGFKQVWILRIKSEDGLSVAQGSLTQRQMKPIEYANYLYEMKRNGSVEALLGGNTSDHVERWATKTHGWSVGFKSKNISKFLQIGEFYAQCRKMPEAQFDQISAQLFEAESVNAADKIRQRYAADEKKKKDGASPAGEVDLRKDPKTLLKRGITAMQKHQANLRAVAFEPATALALQSLYLGLAELKDDPAFAAAVAEGKRLVEAEAVAETQRQVEAEAKQSDTSNGVEPSDDAVGG